MKNLLRGLSDLLYLVTFPSQCRICGNDLLTRREVTICDACLEQVKPDNQNCCSVCGRFTTSRKRCGACLIKPPPYRSHRSFAPYEGTLREIIILYKFGQIIPLRSILAGYFITLIQHQFTLSFDFIVPVPVYKKSKMEGQPLQEISRILSKRLKIPALHGELVKVKPTPPQVGLTYVQRIKNLNSAFKLKGRFGLDGKKILVVDDVFTTGTTIRKCSEALRKGGAIVYAATLAQSLIQ